MFHYLRKGERNASRKLVSRLESTEKKAGIGVAAAEIAVRETKPKESPDLDDEKSEDWLSDALPPDLAAKLTAATEPIRRMEAQMKAATEPLRKVQEEIMASLKIPTFTLADLETRMLAAKAWPRSAEDGKLTPGQLWTKYAPK